MKNKTNLLYGAHVSISGGLYRAIEHGEALHATAIQIFTKSNRQWAAKPLQKKDIETFKAAWKKSNIRSIIVHASYLINIGSAVTEQSHKSVRALTEELNRCDALSIPYLVLHPGSHTKTDEAECLKRISTQLDKAIENSAGTVSVLLETMAGQGSNVGYSFEQIATIIKLSHHKNKIGVCFDTCHAFAAGYDFRTEKSYHALWKHFEKIIGLNKLHAIHINDSKGDLGSRIDRHADLGSGKIGLPAFKLLFNDPRFVNVPKVLETPYKTLQDYEKNMAIIRSLII